MAKKTATNEVAARPSINRVVDISNIVDLLWQRTAENLTATELEWIASASDPAINALRNLADMVEAVGGMLACEASANGLKSGSFQNPSHVATLLYSVSEAMNGIRAQLEVADSAADLLSNGGGAAA